ncbi:efflux RND transporter periplasmic adaptor subunit [bacterium AH-315-J21]|nr:efflux RND transporter periplasmic adaptor subunit [bacterium AH-315-J21]
MSLKSKIITGVIVLAGASVLLFKYGTDAATGYDSEGGETRYKEYIVRRGMFKIDVSATGLVKPIDRVEIKSKASGRIDFLPIEEGDIVRKNDIICRLDKTDVQADFDQRRADLDIAEAELKQAENNFARRQKLFEKKLISREELDNSELSVAQAKGKLVRSRVALDQAQVRLDETEVRSPLDGIMLKKFVEVGQIISSGINNVSGGTAIAALANMSRVYIEAGIDEIDVGKVRIGQEARVVAEAYPRKKFSGQIIRIAPEATLSQNVTQFNVIVEVENESGLLKSGMNASVEITIIEENDMLLAPMLALNSSSGQPQGRGERNSRHVLIKENGEFVERDIKVGRSDFKDAIVLSGLQEGDTIGVAMRSRLKDANDRLEQRIKKSRSFGANTSKSSKKSKPSKKSSKAKQGAGK